MTEQELREKIAHIIAKKLCPNKNRHFALWGDEAHCYSRENFAECEVIADTVDALIAAGIGDVSEYKHRAEKAERALKNEIKLRLKLTNYSEDAIFALYPMALKEAEKELQEEKER